MSNFRTLVCIPLCCLCFFEAAAQSQPSSDVLTAGIYYDKRAASHYVEIASLSPNFLCVGDYVFDTQRAYISLLYKGAPVAKRSHLDSAPPLLHRGVDLSKGYLFIKPRESRRLFIDIGNFTVKPGIYDYKILFPYYLCSDIISTRGAVMRRQIPTHVLESVGTLRIE